MDQRPGRTHEPHAQGSHCSALPLRNARPTRSPSRRLLDAYNFAKRLKTLKGFTPYEYVYSVWTKQPDRFKINPTHLTSGLNTKSVALATFFGFVSSSCSFAALSGARTLFAKGAGLVPSLAFLLASTNLVVELGIIIAIFLGWQFVVGEYVGGVLLILLMWLVVRFTRRVAPIEEARARATQQQDAADDNGSSPGLLAKIRSPEAWAEIAKRYFMEWGMVWKDVTVGFTVAGVIAAFVPKAFFEWLFIGGDDPSFLEVAAQALVGPVAAFFTFIGSMGNIPLAAVLYGNGVAFAGVMAFIFSDLVVIPVLRVNAKYYGWRMALYILAVFLVVLVSRIARALQL